MALNDTALVACSAAFAAGANLTGACAGDVGGVEPLELPAALATASSALLWIAAAVIVGPWCLAAPAFIATFLFRVVPGLLFGGGGCRVPKPLSSSVWTIHGKRYDLSSWVKDHPGGEWAIKLGCNRDCTALFESYHHFADRAKLDKVLARFEIKEGEAADAGPAEPKPEGAADNSTGLVFNDAFHEDVKQMVRAHFQGRSPKIEFPTACICITLACAQPVLIYHFLKGSHAALALLPLVAQLLTYNVVHEGSHFSISSRPWVNSLASCVGMLMSLAPSTWHLQHVVQHHVYTNDEDDIDLYHFLPVCRTSRFTGFAKAFKLQWLTLYVVLPTTAGHLLVVVPTDILTGLVDAVTGKRRYSQVHNLEDFAARYKGSILLELLSFLAFLVTAVSLQGLFRTALLLGMNSYLFIIVTQGAHLRGDCMVSKEGMGLSWAKRQAATSFNFRPDSRLWTFLTGGLNMQSLHHVSPSIHSSHFVALYPEFKKLCAQHGVELKESRNIVDFFRGFVHWIGELAREDDGAAPPAGKR